MTEEPHDAKKIVPGVLERRAEHLRRLRERFGDDLSEEELIDRSFAAFDDQLKATATLPSGVKPFRVFLFEVDNRLGSGDVLVHLAVAKTEEKARELLSRRAPANQLQLKKVIVCDEAQVIATIHSNRLFD